NFEAYAAAKVRIFRNQTPRDVAIVNANLGAVDTPARLWRFSSSENIEDNGAYLDGDELVLCIEGQERRIPRASLRLKRTTNIENALAAWLTAHTTDVDDISVQIDFGAFGGLPHRMVLVREENGVRWVNDSKGTNVDATLKSLESFR